MSIARDQIVVAVTGASGSIYAVQLLRALRHAGRTVHVVISGAARQVAVRELGVDFPATTATTADWSRWIETLLTGSICRDWGFSPDVDAAPESSMRTWNVADYSAGIASGSFPTAGMVICPCSTGTLSAIATGASTNLIHRAADVHLKERRPLVVVPRETPLSSIQLENMVRLSHAGVIVMPAMPAFYHQPRSVADLVNFLIARVLDQLKVPHQLVQPWGT